MDRRLFLTDLSRYAALAAVVPNVWRVTSRPRFAEDPFQLGVASGDPTSTGGVLWTRLAPRPFEPDGGMDGMRTAVNWEVANDDQFKTVVKKGRATAAPELSFSVHIDVDGLEADRWYFYRFTTGDAVSKTGRFRTTPADGATTPLAFAFASCQRWDQGYFTALGHLAQEEIDLAVHLGDYIYEYASPSTAVRKHQGLEIRTLDDYRRRYAQYKSDLDLQAAHARCPWLVTWDDHEVDNNYAGLTGENVMESTEQMRTRRAAAYQAWWEHQPVRVPRAQSWADLTITRTINWGAMARFWMLDTRQYRDPQVCADVPLKECAPWTDPKRGLLGTAQEKWLVDGLGASKSHWQVLANQVMMAPYDSAPGDEVRTSMDQWSGYPVARDRLLNEVAKRAPNRTVTITGDIHTNWVNELHTDFSRPDKPTIGAEFVCTSISSGGDGNDVPAQRLSTMQGDNPHLKWFENRRGYVRCRVTEADWTAEYRSVPFVTKPGAPVHTASGWKVEHGRPGITKTQ
ncbi:alkaline phosphatase D family protein [Gemmatimonas groenlandica]|uniref:Alkaline phosphatase n=1 Tax=Gemmatimonas groenlandica TaxID=2732249 RepID=A0A6M4IRS1_9BACT|nr:alkaline phosphatase D family protein [Gemmatimonas groenlandica]QJR37463.1 alkaline phosphatase [Gemmatimonas groenlandica]